MSCPACTRALTQKFEAMVYASCRGCTVRSVSNATSAARQRYLERLEPKDRTAFDAEVQAELKRRMAMK